jgi:hypothetical protein
VAAHAPRREVSTDTQATGQQLGNELGREEGKMYSADERLAAENAGSSTPAVDRQAATETTTVITGNLLDIGRDRAAAFRQAGQRTLARLGGPEGLAGVGTIVLVAAGCALVAVAAWRFNRAGRRASRHMATSR